MSYSITVVTRDGHSEVITTGELPEGRHEIAGHDATSGPSIEVVRRDAEGRYVTHAQHSPRS